MTKRLSTRGGWSAGWVVGLAAVAVWLCGDNGLLGAAPRAFWVWNRAEPLTTAEVSTLRGAGVERLYWQAGELEPRAGGGLALRRTAPPLAALSPAPGGPEIVPVVRVSTAIRSPESFTGEALGEAVLPWWRRRRIGGCSLISIAPTVCCQFTPTV